MAATLMKKLSAKGIMGSMVAPPVGQTIEQFRVIGYTKGYEIKPTTFGDSTGFSGSFKAVNKITGESFQSSTLYLPDVASDLLRDALDSSDGTVEFGFDISLVGVAGKNPGENDKYEYRCSPIMEASENDPLEALESRLASGVKPKALERRDVPAIPHAASKAPAKPAPKRK